MEVSNKLLATTATAFLTAMGVGGAEMYSGQELLEKAEKYDKQQEFQMISISHQLEQAHEILDKLQDREFKESYCADMLREQLILYATLTKEQN